MVIHDTRIHKLKKYAPWEGDVGTKKAGNIIMLIDRLIMKVTFSSNVHVFEITTIFL